MQFERYGFYPAGGGRFCAEIHPVKALSGIQIGERGEIISRRATAVVANLPRHIAEREVETVGKMLNWGPEAFSVQESRNSPGPGNIVMIEIDTGEVTEISRRLDRSRSQPKKSLPSRPVRHASTSSRVRQWVSI